MTMPLRGTHSLDGRTPSYASWLGWHVVSQIGKVAVLAVLRTDRAGEEKLAYRVDVLVQRSIMETTSI